MGFRNVVIVGVLCLVGTAWGAGKDVVKRIEDMNEAALASYKAGDAEQARKQLMDAVVLGKESDLDTNPVMARTYLNLALIHSEGLADEEKGKRYLALARRINPKIEVPPELADGETSKDVVSQAVAEKEKRDAVVAIADASEARKKERQAAEEAKEAKEQQKTATLDADAAKQREKAAVAEALDASKRGKVAAEERDRLAKDLAATKDAEKQQKGAKEALQKEKATVDKELAQVRDAEKKEREQKEQLQKEKADKEKELAALKEDLKKERETREKVEQELVATKEREGKERSAREQLENDKKAGEARDHARRDRETQEKQARERLAEGPDLPGQIPQPLYCPTADESVRETELFIHCTPQPNVKAKGVALYYRASGSFHFNSLNMERSKRGWFVAAVPAASVTGKVMQYYAEAIDGHGDVVASNAKASSPNIITLRAPGTILATQAPSTSNARKLTRARAIVGKSGGRTAKKELTKAQ